MGQVCEWVGGSVRMAQHLLMKVIFYYYFPREGGKCALMPVLTSIVPLSQLLLDLLWTFFRVVLNDANSRELRFSFTE